MTVTVLAPAGVPGFVTGGGLLLLLLPLPHAVTPRIDTVQSRTNIHPKRRFLCRNGNRRKLAAKAPPVKPERAADTCRFCALGAVVVMVIVVFAAAVPFGVIVAGEKLQDASLGNPEHAKLTAELKPFTGVMDRPIVPLCPGQYSGSRYWRPE